MPKPLDTRIVEYAYETHSAIVPNIEKDEGFSVRLTVSYELQDADSEFIDCRHIEHYSSISETRRTAAQVTAWVAANRDVFIAADKFNLAGYGA